MKKNADTKIGCFMPQNAAPAFILTSATSAFEKKVLAEELVDVVVDDVCAENVAPDDDEEEVLVEDDEEASVVLLSTALFRWYRPRKRCCLRKN